jgi:large subunit ribosomal protein L22
MTGPKLNEANRVAGSKGGTRAVLRNLRTSASKVRVVLDHVRGLDVRSADNVLALMQRDAARDVRKLLASAVANAVHNDEQDVERLYVKACFADEGATLKRFRPRAKGRAGAINKRTCHITMVVDAMDGEILQRFEDREAARASSRASSKAARSARVAASRAKQSVAARPKAEPAAEQQVQDQDGGSDQPEKAEEN